MATDDVFGFNIAPNPFASQANIDLKISRLTSLEIGVYDAVGSLVTIITSGMHVAGTYNFLVDGDALNLSKGIYTLRLISEDKIISKRVVLMK